MITVFKLTAVLLVADLRGEKSSIAFLLFLTQGTDQPWEAIRRMISIETSDTFASQVTYLSY